MAGLYTLVIMHDIERFLSKLASPKTWGHDLILHIKLDTYSKLLRMS